MANSEGMSLAAVAAVAARVVPGLERSGDAQVSDVHIDSRVVTSDSLYVAIRGARADGHDFIQNAVEAGASAVVVEESPQASIPYLKVDDTRQALGWVAAAVYGDPASSLALTGVTGTNGKTTVAHMLAAMAPGSGKQMAVIGTVSSDLEGIASSPRTTPEANNLQRILRQLADRTKTTDVAIEVSSHAMEMGRINGCFFDVVAFTNLSQDHLDYHKTMEAYYAAKAKLFGSAWAPFAVVWTDDHWGKRLAAETELPLLTVGTSDNCDVVVDYGDDTPTGSSFRIRFGGRGFDVRTALAGRFNVANAAIALTCAHVKEWDLEGAVHALATMPPIPGRYNAVANDCGIWIVVDYAHTPDAISSVVDEARHLVPGRVIAVGGAGGDRDQEKRPLMGAALANADIAILTTDNPRSENPEVIMSQVLAGVDSRESVVVEPDRRTAIRRGLALAQTGDAVLILGKGHEASQEYADHTVPFDDAAVAAEELAAMAGERS